MTKAKLCEHCERPRSEHKTKKGEKGRDGEADRPRWPLACPVGSPNSFKLAKPVPDVKTAKVNNNPKRSMLFQFPLEMVDGKWTRKLRCPCCMTFLPPFFSTAGLKQNQGHTRDVTCDMGCHSKFHKPKGWKWGDPLDVTYNAVEAAAKMKGVKNEDDKSANPGGG